MEELGKTVVERYKCKRNEKIQAEYKKLRHQGHSDTRACRILSEMFGLCFSTIRNIRNAEI